MLWKNVIIKKNLPIISNAAVKCEVGGPAKPVAPKAAPPNAQATPPNATTAINARSGGPANHWPQHPFPDLSEGDLKWVKKKL